LRWPRLPHNRSLTGITWGTKIFSAWERRLVTESRIEKKYAPESVAVAKRESRGKKIRLAMNSLDLANGPTF